MQQIFERQRIMHGLSRRIATVKSSTAVDGMRRVRLTSPDFRTLSAAGPHDHIKLFLPLESGELPEFGIDAEGRRFITPGAICRDMTVKEHDGDTIVLDIVDHADGPLINWARHAEPDSPVIVAGPRGSLLAPRPGAIILGADASALPALYRWVEELDDAVQITVIVNDIDTDVASYLEPVRRGRDITIIHTSGSDETIAALTELNPGADHYAWFAGEAGWLVDVRRWLRHSSAILRENMKIDGYWKRGTAGRNHHDPIDPTDVD